MPLYQFEREQKLQGDLVEIWEFISSPANLKKITPEHMGFDILSKNIPEKMYPGMIIMYKVSPLMGIKTTWVTEITHVKELSLFVDEQRVGPYSMWHHQHHLTEIPGGVLMKDIITYRPPLGMLGSLANSLLIQKKLKQIFDFRSDRLDALFGSID